LSSLSEGHEKERVADLAQKAQKLMDRNEKLETLLSLHENSKNDLQQELTLTKE
jgi:hypothetical protein